MTPLVSIILPTFNRARFLPEAFASIDAQTWRHWELIVVDDGSTDDTRALVKQAQERSGQRLQYVFQENRGAYAARNTGLNYASGDYVAFFDSDDLWLPNYLERAVTALAPEPDVDWVYAACRSVDESTGATIAPSTFYVDGRPRPFLGLETRPSRALRVLDSEQALKCHLTSGLYAGLQNSVIRRRLFQTARFWEDYRVVEDVLFLTRALSTGARLGYIDEVLVVYRVHSDNSSASAVEMTPARLEPIFEEEVRGLERVLREVALSKDAAAALRQGLAFKYFWRLGYSAYWQCGDRTRALHAFHRALRLRPFDLRMWKTYLVCGLRSMTGL